MAERDPFRLPAIAVVLAVLSICSAAVTVWGTASRPDRPTGATVAAAPPGGTAVPAVDVAGDEHVHGPEDDHVHGTAVADGTSPCEVAKAVTPALSGDHGHHGPRAPTDLDPATRAALDRQLDAVRALVSRYPTAAEATAAGFRKGAPYLPCIAAHYTKPTEVDATFDPATPEQLLFDGNTPEARLVGFSYLVASGSASPDGFAGPDDEWHQHIGLCLRDGRVVGGAQLTDEQCRARQGVKATAGTMWMVHAWVVPGHESAWGVFSGENPALGALSVPAT